ncbi:MAG: helix-turn-helix domain-containing protein [Pirellulaceae bacterium]
MPAPLAIDSSFQISWKNWILIAEGRNLLLKTERIQIREGIYMQDQVLRRLDQIEQLLLQVLKSKAAIQDFYSTSDVAKLLRRAEWTVREWCRLGRVHAKKRMSGRGIAKEWMISHQELERIKSEGLLPPNQARYSVE